MFICLPCVGVCLNGIAEAKHTIFVFNVFVFVDKIVIKYTTIEGLTIRKGKYFFNTPYCLIIIYNTNKPTTFFFITLSIISSSIVDGSVQWRKKGVPPKQYPFTFIS
jgi:hypothetical protein